MKDCCCVKMRWPGVGKRFAVAFALICTLGRPGVAESILFRDVTTSTGVKFRHTDGSSGQRYIVETVTAGLALFDYDNDGDEDIYFLNGAPLKGTKFDKAPTNALYRNDGNWKFTDVTARAGVGDTGYGLGVAAGDYDNDGDLDLYVNNYGPNVLYRNNGDGTFTDVTAQAGVDNGAKTGAGACFLDIEGDGDLDLYVANYVDFTYDKHVTTPIDGYVAYVGPLLYDPVPDALYRNNGDGTFTDISEESGVTKAVKFGMGMICGDYDDDGDTDIFVANDMTPNFLLQNDGKGKFEDMGLMAGVAYDVRGSEMGSMGAEFADYDNDGLVDLFVTSYAQQMVNLYRNVGDGLFEDVTRLTGAGAGTIADVTWGCALADFDNDGDRDIFIACGHLLDNVELYDDRTTYFQQNVLLENNGEGKFRNISNEAGDGLKVKLSSRGAAFDDLDNDGDIDVVILNARREPTILRNDTPSKGHWIQIRLRGTKSNRDGVGARVKVVAGDLSLIDEVHSGRSYQSHYGMRLHFGLGNRERVDRIEVRWIGGGVDVFKDVEVDRLLTLVEGSSKEAL